MLLLNGSANRDDRHFPDGDRFDIHRDDRPPPELRLRPALLPRRRARPPRRPGRARRGAEALARLGGRLGPRGTGPHADRARLGRAPRPDALSATDERTSGDRRCPDRHGWGRRRAQTTVTQGREDARTPRRGRQSGVRARRLPRRSDRRHRRHRQARARQLLPLLRLEGRDLPRGRRSAGRAADRATRVRAAQVHRRDADRPDPPLEPRVPRALPRRSRAHGRDRAGVALRRARQRSADGNDEALRRASRARDPAHAARRLGRPATQPFDDCRRARRHDRSHRRAVAGAGLSRVRLRRRRRAAHHPLGERARVWSRSRAPRSAAAGASRS